MTQIPLEKVCGILDASLAEFIRKELDGQRNANAKEYDFQLRDAAECINTLNSSTESFAHYDGKLLPYLYALYYHVQRSAEVFEITKLLLSGTHLRVPSGGPLEIIDLGHGTGATTTALRCLSAVHPELFQRPDRMFTAVNVYGVDSSVEMLEFAQNFDNVLGAELDAAFGSPATQIKRKLALEYRCWTRGCPKKLRKETRPCLLLGHYLADRPNANYAAAFANRLHRVLRAEQVVTAVVTSSESKLQMLAGAMRSCFANGTSDLGSTLDATTKHSTSTEPKLPLYVMDSASQRIPESGGISPDKIQQLATKINEELCTHGTSISKRVVSWRSYGNSMIALYATNVDMLRKLTGQDLSRSVWDYSSEMLGKAGTTFEDVSSYINGNKNSGRVIRLVGSAGTGKSLIAFHVITNRIQASLEKRDLYDRSEHVHAYITFEPALAEHIYNRLVSYSNRINWTLEDEREPILGSQSRARLLRVRGRPSSSSMPCRVIISTWDSLPSLILDHVQDQDTLSAHLRSKLAAIGRSVSHAELDDVIRFFNFNRITRHCLMSSKSMEMLEEPTVQSAFQEAVLELSKNIDTPLTALFHHDTAKSPLINSSSSTWIFDEAQDLCPIRAAWIKDVLCGNARDQVVVIAADTAQQIRGRTEIPKHIIALTKNRKRATLTECFRTSRNIWRAIQCLRYSNPQDDDTADEDLREFEESLLGCPVGPRVRVIARDEHSRDEHSCVGSLAAAYVASRIKSGFQEKQWRCGDGSKASSRILQRVSSEVSKALAYEKDIPLSYTTLKDVRGQEYPNVLWASDATARGQEEDVDMKAAMRRLYSFLMRAETEVVLALAGQAKPGFEYRRLLHLVSRLKSVRRHLRFHDAESAAVFNRLCSSSRSA